MATEQVDRVEVFAQVAEALRDAHQREGDHRDRPTLPIAAEQPVEREREKDEEQEAADLGEDTESHREVVRAEIGRGRGRVGPVDERRRDDRESVDAGHNEQQVKQPAEAGELGSGQFFHARLMTG